MFLRNDEVGPTENMTMINKPLSQPSSALLPVAAMIGLPLAVIAIALSQSAPISQPLAAVETSTSSDLDGDGLTDDQELVLGTSIERADTDGDGVSDLEEFARHSDPLSRADIPEFHAVSVAMSARGGGGFNHIFAAVYVASGDFSNKRLAFGAAARGRLVTFNNAEIDRRSTTTTVDVGGSGRVYIVDRRVSPRTIRRLGYISFYGAIGFHGATNPFDAAAVVDLQTIGGYTTLVHTDYAQADWFAGGITLAPMNGGSAHVPIPASGGSGGDDDATAGAACVQQTAAVGSSGSILTRQVTSAACEDGWDSFCAGSCSSSTGSTFDTVDPIALVGG